MLLVFGPILPKALKRRVIQSSLGWAINFLCSMTRRDPESGCLWYPLCLAAALRNTCTLEYKAKNGRAHVQQRKLPEPKQRVNFIDFRICRDLSLWCSYCGGGLVAKLCPTLMTPWTVAHQAPLSMGFSRQEYWSGLPFPSPGDLPNTGIEPGSPALWPDSLTTELLYCVITNQEEYPLFPTLDGQCLPWRLHEYLRCWVGRQKSKGLYITLVFQKRVIVLKGLSLTISGTEAKESGTKSNLEKEWGLCLSWCSIK